MFKHIPQNNYILKGYKFIWYIIEGDTQMLIIEWTCQFCELWNNLDPFKIVTRLIKPSSNNTM
ncbi:MAG TPA: hypothetical protein DCP32_00355 [Anaerolineaceae bacterium]|nr:MAG: hypothetical protein A2X24_09845 [Chloroflexi bacterium GWB2_54_36]HAL15237.1 hypothetical protein [Anaerolineaceae bacterium]HBA91267.1 hypothetical protein [Anaerolineaceae bacterium]